MHSGRLGPGLVMALHMASAQRMDVLSSLITAHPELSHFSITTLFTYISLIKRLKPRICHCSVELIPPPTHLPRPVHQFLQDALKMDARTVCICWEGLKDIAWNPDLEAEVDIKHIIPLFLEFGTPVELGIFELFPPFSTCIRQECPSLHNNTPTKLSEFSTRKSTLFTLAHGSLPIFSTSAYCRSCLTRYHHNFCVTKSVRCYYGGSIPNIIELSGKFSVERELCEQFVRHTVMAWTSFTNHSRMYNENLSSFSWVHLLPETWPIEFTMDSEQAANVFFIYCVLAWCYHRDLPVQVPHRSTQPMDRWHNIIDARNQAMAGPGQPEWNHVCNLCTKYTRNESGCVTAAIRSVVVDGVSLGHPCCGVQDCKNELPTSKHRYCTEHKALNDKCAVNVCHADVTPGYKTCIDLSHRAVEIRYKAKGTSIHLLQRRLETEFALQSSHLSEKASDRKEEDVNVDFEDSMEDEHIEIELEDNEMKKLTSYVDKPLNSVRRSFARFGRRHTHNEQLCVASCGVILGRATFYGAEGIHSVLLFLKALFPTKKSLPSVIWFDNNCQLSKHIKASGEDYFQQVALPVDVFHFRSKHKVSDHYCGQNCNPVLWEELIDKTTKKWIFNSSAAEQANMWFGRFQSMTRLMRRDRYNFLLDEVILRRNACRVAELRKQEYVPYSIPRCELLH